MTHEHEPLGAETGVSAELAANIVRVARTGLGDTLRSVVYFTPDAFEVLYVRRDLDGTAAAARATRARLVEFERAGFVEGPARSTFARRDGGADIGGYEFTVRFHEHGFVARVIEDGAGVLLTADEMDVRAFEEAGTAIRRLLEGTDRSAVRITNIALTPDGLRPTHARDEPR